MNTDEGKEKILWHGGPTCSVTRWLDFYQYLAIYNNENLPKAFKYCQSGRLKVLTNTRLTLRKNELDVLKLAKVAKFRLTWSQYLPHTLV